MDEIKVYAAKCHAKGKCYEGVTLTSNVFTTDITEGQLSNSQIDLFENAGNKLRISDLFKLIPNGDDCDVSKCNFLDGNVPNCLYY